MINKKVLLKSLGYSFIPTLTVLLITLLITFSIQDTISLISSKEVYWYRLILLVIEIGVCVYLYHYFDVLEHNEMINNLAIEKSKENQLFLSTLGSDLKMRDLDSYHVRQVSKLKSWDNYGACFVGVQNDEYLIIKKIK
jgi:hypothetical protein